MPRWALEYHFGFGRVAVKERLANFQRVYDLPERLVGAQHLETSLADEEAQRSLLRIAARGCGVATLHDLADYFRMSPRDARPRIRELVEEGSLSEVNVENWSETAYLDTSARTPRCVERETLLSPFDPLIWFRPRAERLFDFHYRIEIYVPEAKRRWGYYVLPFLMGDRLAARVDLKAERKSRTLLVRAAHLEECADGPATADSLAAELRRLSAWLGLDSIAVGRKGSLSRVLRQAVAARAVT